MVVAIGLVVDDAIVVSRRSSAISRRAKRPGGGAQRHGRGVRPDCRHRAGLVLRVFPDLFIPGITGKLYQQFAVTIAISVLLSLSTP